MAYERGGDGWSSAPALAEGAGLEGPRVDRIELGPRAAFDGGDGRHAAQVASHAHRHRRPPRRDDRHSRHRRDYLPDPERRHAYDHPLSGRSDGRRRRRDAEFLRGDGRDGAGAAAPLYSSERRPSVATRLDPVGGIPPQPPSPSPPRRLDAVDHPLVTGEAEAYGFDDYRARHRHGRQKHHGHRVLKRVEVYGTPDDARASDSWSDSGSSLSDDDGRARRRRRGREGRQRHRGGHRRWRSEDRAIADVLAGGRGPSHPDRGTQYEDGTRLALRVAEQGPAAGEGAAPAADAGVKQRLTADGLPDLRTYPDDPDEAVPPCVECNRRDAARHCLQCNDLLCEPCFNRLHGRGTRATHRYVSVLSKAQRVTFSILNLQRIIRGHLIRRKYSRQLLLHRERMKRVTYDVMNDLLDEFVTTEFMPEMLIDIFSNKGDDFVPVTKEEMDLWDAREAIISEVVAELAGRAVKRVIKDAVDTHLATSSVVRTRHPLLGVLDDVVGEGVRECTREVVTVAVDEMVEEYMFSLRFDEWMAAELAPMIEEVADESLHEMQAVTLTDRLLAEVVVEESRAVAEEVVEERKTDIEEAKRAHQIALISSYAQERVFQTSALRYMVGQIATHAERQARKDGFRMLLHGAMLRYCIQRARVVERHRDAVRNAGIAQLVAPVYEDVTAGATASTLVGMFSHALDDLEADLHVREVGHDRWKGAGGALARTSAAVTRIELLAEEAAMQRRRRESQLFAASAAYEEGERLPVHPLDERIKARSPAAEERPTSGVSGKGGGGGGLGALLGLESPNAVYSPSTRKMAARADAARALALARAGDGSANGVAAAPDAPEST